MWPKATALSLAEVGIFRMRRSRTPTGRKEPEHNLHTGKNLGETAQDESTQESMYAREHNNRGERKDARLQQILLFHFSFEVRKYTSYILGHPVIIQQCLGLKTALLAWLGLSPSAPRYNLSTGL